MDEKRTPGAEQAPSPQGAAEARTGNSGTSKPDQDRGSGEVSQGTAEQAKDTLHILL